MRVTLQQKKSALHAEKEDIERLIERRHATTAHRERLEDIETMLRVFEDMEKPDSMAKKAKEETG